jgi:hypothetical protein
MSHECVCVCLTAVSPPPFAATAVHSNCARASACGLRRFVPCHEGRCGGPVLGCVCVCSPAKCLLLHACERIPAPPGCRGGRRSRALSPCCNSSSIPCWRTVRGCCDAPPCQAVMGDRYGERYTPPLALASVEQTPPPSPRPLCCFGFRRVPVLRRAGGGGRGAGHELAPGALVVAEHDPRGRGHLCAAGGGAGAWALLVRGGGGVPHTRVFPVKMPAATPPCAPDPRAPEATVSAGPACMAAHRTAPCARTCSQLH